jgi:hypothetical protein
MRHPILPCRPTLVYSTSWDFPVRWPAPIITFWFISYAVFKTRALTSSNSLYLWGAKQAQHQGYRPPSLPRKSASTSPPRPRWQTLQGFSRTTHIQNNPSPSRTSSNLQAPRPPTPLGLDSPLDIVWLLFWLHRQHDAVSVV